MANSETRENPLAQRLSELVDNPRGLANHLGCSVQAVNQYKLGTAYPKTENLIKIAQYYNVSIDYLIGLTDVKSPDASIRAISEATGLSERSLNILAMYPYHVETLNQIVESDVYFPILMDALAEYKMSVKEATDYLSTPVDELPVPAGPSSYMSYVRKLELSYFEVFDYIRFAIKALGDFDEIRQKVLTHGQLHMAFQGGEYMQDIEDIVKHKDELRKERDDGKHETKD